MTVQPSIVGLRSVEMFAQMSTSRLEELAPQFAWKRVAAGQHLVSRDALDREVANQSIGSELPGACARERACY